MPDTDNAVLVSQVRKQPYLFSVGSLAVQLCLHGIRLLTGTVYGSSSSSSSNMYTAYYQ